MAHSMGREMAANPAPAMSSNIQDRPAMAKTHERRRIGAADADGGMKLVDEISAAFQARFGQDPVFRMWNPACAGIYRP